MKIIGIVVFILVIVVGGLFGYTYYKGTNPFIASPTPTIQNTSPSPTPAPFVTSVQAAITPPVKISATTAAKYKNMFLTVPDTSYKVTVPALNTPVSYEQGNNRGNVIVTGPVDFIEKTGTYAATLNVNSGGSGTLAYVVLFQKNVDRMDEITTAPIADRVPVQSITIDETEKGTVVEVTYLERKPDEPMVAEPTVEQTKTFTLVSGKLVVQ